MSERNTGAPLVPRGVVVLAVVMLVAAFAIGGAAGRGCADGEVETLKTEAKVLRQQAADVRAIYGDSAASAREVVKALSERMDRVERQVDAWGPESATVASESVPAP
jgi:hypothetical protein